MAVEKDNYQQAIKAMKRLSREQQRRLIEELTIGLDDALTPLAIVGTWRGVSLSADEIDEARRGCWTRLGEDE
ncbi:MAG TPA: hypothetical protein VNN73_06830 [Blastocatellia bacterium]|nr:hypothetical protein [Blastocatellia bacterium]